MIPFDIYNTGYLTEDAEVGNGGDIADLSINS